MKIIEDTTQYKDLNFKKDTILDLCNLCSVSYNTNKVLKKKYNNKEIIFDKCRKCPASIHSATLRPTPTLHSGRGTPRDNEALAAWSPDFK